MGSSTFPIPETEKKTWNWNYETETATDQFRTLPNRWCRPRKEFKNPPASSPWWAKVQLKAWQRPYSVCSTFRVLKETWMLTLDENPNLDGKLFLAQECWTTFGPQGHLGGPEHYTMGLALFFGSAACNLCTSWGYHFFSWHRQCWHSAAKRL